MISINNLTVAYGGFTLLDDINFHISGTDRIGLVGKNGAGKSTLLKLICGIQNPTGGKVSVPSGCKIGYLPQIMEHHRGRTVIQEAMTAFDEMHRKEKELEEVSAELASRSDYESAAYMGLMLRMNELTDSLALSHSEMPEIQARRTLRGLGFKENELNRPVETFSQGWNMRIELAKILLRHPDVLLLDEPTNHLDIESIEWLEDYLRQNKSALVLISHDRKFLDNVTNRTVEIMLGHIHDYKVPYSKYLELRAERMEQQRAAYENQQRMIEKTEEFIERFRYKPTKSNQVQSRVKALEKLDRIEIDVEDKSTLSVKFPPAPRSGDVVFKGTDLTVGYPASAGVSEKTVFSGADIEIKRGEKVAFVGRNGEGKTTLMRVIMKQLEPFAGEAVTGHNVSIGYYEQNQEDVLDRNNTVFGTLDDIAVGDIRTRLRDILAAFLFKGEDIDKKVSVLSGGERARLAMAKLMLRPYNLLALDEPTNHMDIRSKDVLKQALASYNGTLVVVSHDRDFLDGLVYKIYEFRDGRVKEHLGGLQDYLYRRKLENLNELERSGPDVKDESIRKPDKEEKKQAAPAPARTQPAPEGRKFISKEERKIRQQAARLEEEISELEKQLKEIESKLMQPGDGDNVMELTDRYLRCKSLIDARTEQWAELLENIED